MKFRKRQRVFKINKAEVSHNEQVMAICTTHVNKDMIRRESIDGVEHIIIRSMTLPDDIVMNGGLYPAEEIKKSFLSLERTLAPVEHPQDSQGNYISANDPVAIANYYAGAYNANVERVGNRVKVDKVINVQEAMKSERGRRLLDRINEMETSDSPRAIHTSTGVWLTVEELREPAVNEAGQEYTWIAKDMAFDHDAILLDSVGAAQPSQGVGMAVNRGKQFKVHSFEISAIKASKNLPLAPSDHTWDKSAATQRVREKIGATEAPNAAYARAHLWYDPDQAENFGAYKLPFVDVIDGELMAVPAALRNAAARLGQTDGPSDSEKTTIRNIIDGYLEKLRGNAQGMTTDEKTAAIVQALEKQAIGVQYIEAVYEDEVIFYSKETLFSVPYRIDDVGIASIVGIPTPVERIVTYSPKTNAIKGDSMKEIILNALKAKGIETDGLSDDELMSKYNEMIAESNAETGSGSEGNEGGVAEAVANAIKPIADQLEAIKANLSANASAKKAEHIGVIMNSGIYPDMDEESLNMLGEEQLGKMAANCKPAYGINFNRDGGKSEQFSAPAEMPE